MKRIIGVLIAVLLLSAVSGMSAFAADPPTVLTVAIADRTNVQDYNTNDVTLWLEKTRNVDLRFNVYESGDYNNKMNLKIASGDKLEDIIIGNFSDTVVYSWAKDGALASLTDFFKDKTLAVSLYDAMRRVGYDFRGSITLPDGNIYYIPVLNQSYGNECVGKNWVYKPWLEKLRMSAPATTEDFYILLKAVVNSDANGNGKADEVGLAGFGGIYGPWFSYLMNAFVYTDTANQFMKVQGGTLSYSFTEDAWRKGIEWMAKLVAERVMPTETVTQAQAAWQTMVNTKDITAFTMAYSTPSLVTDVNRKSQYVALAPLKGPNGVQYTQYNPSKPSCAMIITKDCRNPKAAFTVGDLLVGEENSIVTRFGKRGADWDYIFDVKNAKDYISPYPGFNPYIVVYHDVDFWGSGKMQNRSWMQAGPYIRQYGIANGMGVNPANVAPFSVNEAAGICLYQQGGYFPKETIGKLIYTDKESSVITDVSSSLSTLVQETMANWIIGNTKLDNAAWDKFQATVRSVGAYDMLKAAQAAYTRSLPK
jgi:putative aldouronate transport system substrate-binding protein